MNLSFDQPICEHSYFCALQSFQIIIILFIFLLNIKQPHQVITLNGSIRIKTCDLELPQPQQQQTIQSSQSNSSANVNTPNQQQHGNAIENESGRAVDNQYSFV